RRRLRVAPALVTTPVPAAWPTPRPPKPGQRLTAELRSLLARVPLRVKLVTVMLALVAVALIVIGSVSAVALRNHLVDRVDEQLAFQLNLYAPEAEGIPCAGTEVLIPSDFLIALSRPTCPDVSR